MWLSKLHLHAARVDITFVYLSMRCSSGYYLVCSIRVNAVYVTAVEALHTTLLAV